MFSIFRGFGFVTYAEQAGVEKVLAQNRHELDSKTVSFEELDPATYLSWVNFAHSVLHVFPPFSAFFFFASNPMACKVGECCPPPPPPPSPLSAHFPLQIPVQGANMKAFFLGLHCHGYLGDLNGVGAPCKKKKKKKNSQRVYAEGSQVCSS